MKKLVVFLLVCAFPSCKSDDPQAELLVGRWEVISIKDSPSTNWQQVDTKSVYKRQIDFKVNGAIGADNQVIWGPYCSPANQYVFKQSRLFFKYGQIGCTTLIIDPPAPEFATVEELSSEFLTITFGATSYRLKR